MLLEQLLRTAGAGEQSVPLALQGKERVDAAQRLDRQIVAVGERRQSGDRIHP